MIAAGVYELTRVKQHCRRCCRESARSGFALGLYCVGSSLALMVMLVALGVMKLLLAKPAIDLPLALGIVALGILILIAP